MALPKQQIPPPCTPEMIMVALDWLRRLVSVMREKGADGFAMVHTTNRLAEDVGDIQNLKLGASLSVLMLRYGVGDNHFVNGRRVNARNRISAENAVSDKSVDS